MNEVTTDPYDIESNEEVLQAYSDMHDCKIEFVNYEHHNPDLSIYTECTADGYEVWVMTEDTRHPSLSQDIYYYQPSEADILCRIEQIMNGYEIFVMLEDDMEDGVIEEMREALSERYNDYLEENEETESN